MNNKTLIILAVALIGFAAGITLGYISGHGVFEGQSDKGDDCYRLEFTKMNGTDSNVMALYEGAELVFDFDLTRGSFGVTVVSEGGEKIYSGSGLKSGGFSVTVPEAGSYTVTVTAKHAAGYIHIDTK